MSDQPASEISEQVEVGAIPAKPKLGKLALSPIISATVSLASWFLLTLENASVLLYLPLIAGSVIAAITGRKAMRQARDTSDANYAVAAVGTVLGSVSAILMALFLLLGLLFVLFLAAIFGNLIS